MQAIFAWTPLLEPLSGELSAVVSSALDTYFSTKPSRVQRALWRVTLKELLEVPQVVCQPPVSHSSEYLTAHGLLVQGCITLDEQSHRP